MAHDLCDVKVPLVLVDGLWTLFRIIVNTHEVQCYNYVARIGKILRKVSCIEHEYAIPTTNTKFLEILTHRVGE